MKRFLCGATLAAIGILALGTMQANAAPVTYNFNGTFSDGATATGVFSLNTYGFPSVPTSITSTNGLFAGFNYALPGDPSSILASSTVLVLSSPSYNRYLYLDFTNPLTNGAADPLISNASFECDAYGTGSYACTGDSSHIRYFTSGSATPVPEPMTWSIFAAGLAVMAGFAFGGRRKIRAPVLAAG